LFDGCSIDDAIKRGKKEIATYNKMIAEIPARIDELNNQRTVVDVSDMELQKNALLEKIADLEKQREDLLSNSKEVEKIADRILELKFEKSDIEKKAADKLLAERKEFENAVYKAETEFADLLNRQRKSEQAINSTLSAIKQFELHKDLLAQQYKDVRSEQIGENAHICPTCGQNLPEESISEIEAKFAASKTERLAKISAEGMETKNIIDEDQKTVEDEKKRLEEIKSLKLKLEANKAKAMEQLNKLPEQIDLSDNQEYEKICAEIAKLEEAVNEKRNSDYTACLIKEISATRNELEYVNEHLAKADNSTIDDRIAELQEEQREIAQKIADSEKDVYMLEEFNRAKISMMTEKINGHFSLVTWKLFDMQQNGRYKEVCIPTFEGADYGNGLNTGHAIATEIDITATLQKINKVSVPVFLDNAESINAGNIPEIDCQLITLNVTEDDKEMRVEVEE
jgi:DNA repair exonuclease SbcCD ATPase subunit